MDAMLEAFITESRGNLETAGRCFLALENDPDNEELMNDLFRSMHTIKGSSGLFDMLALTKVVHAAEDVLDNVRAGEIRLTSEHIDLFLDTMDQINIWLDDLEKTEQLPASANDNSQVLTQGLRQLLGDGETTREVETQPPSQQSEYNNEDTIYDETPKWLIQVPDENRLEIFKRSIDDGTSIIAIEYTPDSQCFFTGEDPLHTVINIPGLLWFGIKPLEDWPPHENLDPYKCNLIFYIVTLESSDKVNEYLRYVTEQVKISILECNQLIFPYGEMGESEPFDAFIEAAPTLLLENNLTELKQLISPLQEISSANYFQTSVLRWMNVLLDNNFDTIWLTALLNSASTGEFIAPQDPAGENKIIIDTDDDIKKDQILTETLEPSALSDIQQKSLQQALSTQQKILLMPCLPELMIGRIASVTMVVSNLLEAIGISNDDLLVASNSAKEKSSLEPLIQYFEDFNLTTTKQQQNESDKQQDVEEKEDIISTQENSDVSSVDGATKKPIIAKVLKVDQQRIDVLMDLIGELVVAKNAIPYLAKRAEDDFGIRSLAKEISSQYAVINRLSEELQSTMMQIRMVPISNVFQRFPRLVRDLSRKLNKNIKLVLEGEETEADKNVVENLADPLIHLVRNSLDHGIETEQERHASGKNTEATLKLRAIPQEDQVVIEVIDDGRGINPSIIKRKAYEKKVIDEARLDSITDQEALQLILAPGFSTAEEVSDLSGRGVGMDVVHSVVSQAGGSVAVESEMGKGTTIRLSLPLSMAVNRVMMIEVANQSYGVSMEHIVETVRIPLQRIQKIKHREAVVLRDRLIPLFHLCHLLNIKSSYARKEEASILVMNVAGEEIGLIIDDFHEGIDIIQKPLEGVMSNYPYYSGAALLGDGRVLLILDIMELFSCQ